ncbi:uncharacterized protein [Engystomops pustulosus]|uniref:uncharacterized protein n=1 Tax=Engystomops pustulosus TaxID=76066 RepID=UPI003AFADE04
MTSQSAQVLLASVFHKQMDYEMNSYDFMAISYSSSGVGIYSYSESIEIVRNNHTPMEETCSTHANVMEYLSAQDMDFNPFNEELPPISSMYSTGCGIVNYIQAPPDGSRSESPDIMLYSPQEGEDFNLLYDEMPPFSYWRDTGCEIVKHIRAPSDGSRSTSPRPMEDFPEEEYSSDDDLPPIYQDPEDSKILYDVSSLNVDSWMDHESTENTEEPRGPRRWSLGWMRLGLRRMTNALFSCHRGQQVEE